MGVEGRIAREVVSLARARLGVEAVTTSLRAPGTARPALVPEPSASATGALPVAPSDPASIGTADTTHAMNAAGGDAAAASGPPSGVLQALGGHGAAAVVHVALSTDLGLDLRLDTPKRRSGLLELTRAAFAATAPGGLLVAVTSARVYGAHPDNPVPLPPDATLRAQDDEGLVGDLLAVEAEISRLRAQRPDVRVTILRPAALVGPGVDTTITRHFETPRLLVLGGSEPMWQFVHVEDVASAILTLLLAQEDLAAPSAPEQADPVPPARDRCVDGGWVVTVGAPGALTQVRIEEITGKRRLVLPAVTALGAARRLQAAGVLSTSGADLDYVRHPWVVGSSDLDALGWAPRFDNEACVQVMIEQIRRNRSLAALRRDAAVGTASAGVALVGTAALLRRRRRRF